MKNFARYKFVKQRFDYTLETSDTEHNKECDDYTIKQLNKFYHKYNKISAFLAEEMSCSSILGLLNT